MFNTSQEIGLQKKNGKVKKGKSKKRRPIITEQTIITHPIRDDINKYYRITDQVLGM